MDLHSLHLLIDRCLRRETVLRASLMGQTILLSVEARREIRRLRNMDREAAFVQRMLAYLSSNDTLYDIGANIGLIGLLLAAHESGKSCRLLCFEPEPRNVRQLRRNIELNGLSGRATAHALALGSRQGEVDLFVRGQTGDGCHSIVSAQGSTKSIRVPLSTVDAMARATGRPPDVVKIDVEGAEGHVLAGMEETIRERRVREIFLELHEKGNGRNMPDGQPLHDWLLARGYRLAWECERRTEHHRHYRPATSEQAARPAAARVPA